MNMGLTELDATVSGESHRVGIDIAMWHVQRIVHILALQKVWGTLRAFVEAFGACETRKEGEILVETRWGAMVGRAKVKGVLGAKVADIWDEA